MVPEPSNVVRRARLSAEPLSVDRLLGLVQDRAVGGIGLFVGVVRDHDDDPTAEVVTLDYTAHPTAERELIRCVEEVSTRHDVLAVAVEHRTGRLQVGDLAVVVAAGAVHRGAALAATEELIDEIKRRVPIWKEQEFASGHTSWVGLSP